MHCARCYRQIEPGTDACHGCGLAVPMAAPTRGGPAQPYGTPPPGPGAPYGYGTPGSGAPSGYGPAPYGAPPGYGLPPGAPPGYGPAPYAAPPGYGLPPGPRPTTISNGRVVALAVSIGVVIILIAAAYITRAPAPTFQARSRPLPTPSFSRGTFPPTRPQTLDDLMVPADQLASGPSTPDDPGSHLTPAGALAKLFDPTAARPIDEATIVDTSHRASTDAGGVARDLTVIQFEDAASAAALVNKVSHSTTLGTPTPMPDLAGAVAFERTAGQGSVETVVLAERNYVVIVAVTLPAGFPTSAQYPQHIDVVVPLATLQDKLLACAPTSRMPRNC